VYLCLTVADPGATFSKLLRKTFVDRDHCISTKTLHQLAVYIQGEPKKVSQHKNYDIAKMRDYFFAKFCSFVYKTTVHMFAALCCIYLTYTKLTETQTSRMNFATAQIVQKADFIIKVNEWPIPLLLWCHCDVGIIIWFTLEKND